MMTLTFFLLGGLSGICAWLYIDRFIPNLQQEIYQNYIELYPENRPIFHSEKAAIQSQKCGQFYNGFLKVTLFLKASVVIFSQWKLNKCYKLERKVENLR